MKLTRYNSHGEVTKLGPIHLLRLIYQVQINKKKKKKKKKGRIQGVPVKASLAKSRRKRGNKPIPDCIDCSPPTLKNPDTNFLPNNSNQNEASKITYNPASRTLKRNDEHRLQI